MLIGAKLRAARELRSLTLDQVALSAGLTKGLREQARARRRLPLGRLSDRGV